MEPGPWLSMREIDFSRERAVSRLLLEEMAMSR
jgi:hypothetical protein